MKLKFKQMKTRLLFLLFIAFSLGLEAQGDLQFNQVLTFAGTTGSTVIYTVPEGKVAKITKAKGIVLYDLVSLVCVVLGVVFFFAPGSESYDEMSDHESGQSKQLIFVEVGVAVFEL